MNDMNVPNSENTAAASDEVLESLAHQLSELTPELRKAAAYVLENPNDVGVSSIREMADAANVKPNTLVRLARTIGFDGYEDFREPFREEIRQGKASFPDRARWLQSLRAGGKLDALYADMASSAISNLEETFCAHFFGAIESCSRNRLGVTKGLYAWSWGKPFQCREFHLSGLHWHGRFHAIPKPGSAPVDDLAWADERDILIAITCKPYRKEVVEAVRIAREQGVRVIGISDSPASPIIIGSDHGFVVSVDTPQFFPSSVSTLALLETLLSFVIAVASPEIVERVERFHKRRHELGIYAMEQEPGK